MRVTSKAAPTEPPGPRSAGEIRAQTPIGDPEDDDWDDDSDWDDDDAPDDEDDDDEEPMQLVGRQHCPSRAAPPAPRPPRCATHRAKAG